MFSCCGGIWGPGGQARWCFYRVSSMCYSFHTQTGTRLSRKIQNIALFIREKSMVLSHKNHFHGTLSGNAWSSTAGSYLNLMHKIASQKLRRSDIHVNEFNLREFNPWVGGARPLGRWRIGIRHGVYSQNERATRGLACALYMSLYSAIYVALYSALYRDISIYWNKTHILLEMRLYWPFLGVPIYRDIYIWYMYIAIYNYIFPWHR